LITDQRDLGNGLQAFKINVVGKPLDPPRIGRALYKVALGLVALDHGPEVVRSIRYEAAREFVLGRRPFRNSLLMFTTARPEPRVVAQYLPMDRGTMVAMTIYGVCFGFNLEEGPLLDFSRLPPGIRAMSFRLDAQPAT
jgi:hypothetical protein